MADAELEKTTAKIDISTNKETLTAQGEVLKFEGFLKVYKEDRDEEDINDDETAEGMLPPLVIGQTPEFKEMKATERFSRPSPRYTEASLVKKLEELGIGRPSTYAPTITTVQKRGYVERRDKEGIKRDYRVLVLAKDAISKGNPPGEYRRGKVQAFPDGPRAGSDRLPQPTLYRDHGLRVHGQDRRRI